MPSGTQSQGLTSYLNNVLLCQKAKPQKVAATGVVTNMYLCGVLWVCWWCGAGVLRNLEVVLGMLMSRWLSCITVMFPCLNREQETCLCCDSGLAHEKTSVQGTRNMPVP